VQDLLVGTPVGDVYPRDPSIDGVPVDGRTAALQSLGVYLTSLVYCRPGRLGGPPVYFAIPPENFHVDRPPSEVDLIFPALVALSGPVTARSRGLIPTVDESTRDVYGAGTALIVQEEREETVPLEVWSSTLPELRAILAKLEQAFHPTEERNGFLLRTPAYYWRTARFILEAPEHPDEPMAVQNRFKGVVRVFVAYDVVHLVHVRGFRPAGQVDAESPAYADPRVAAAMSRSPRRRRPGAAMLRRR
jgi:hypothetical protein